MSVRIIGEKVEVTTDHFGDMVNLNCLLVDKTPFIKDFWDGQKVTVVLRPRRFGKSLNLSMLQHFFASHVSGIATNGLFDNLAIVESDGGKFLAQHQGQHPVILTICLCGLFG